MNTILITGCSSGFGLETARHFLDQGWSVVATMRSPRQDLLPRSDRLRVLPLDVSDAESIERAVTVAGPIDVLVNNAGIGFLNAAEDTPIAIAREIFETNTLGTIALVQAVLPQFRDRGAGVIINVSSSATLKALPLLSVYSASKAAVNAFTESLAQEVGSLGIRVHLVLPGLAPETSFSDNAQKRMQGGFSEPYAGIADSIFASWQTATEHTHSKDVAEAVWQLATDPSSPLRLPAGADAKTWMRDAANAPG